MGLLCLLFTQFATAQSPAQSGRITGIVLPIQEVTISSSIAGIVENIDALEGEELSANELILKLNDASDLLNIQRYQQVLEKRLYDNDSIQQLYNEEIISEGQALESSIELSVAQLDLKQAELQQQRKLIRTPFSGVLAKLYVDTGEWVNQGDPVADFINTKQVIVRLVIAPSFAKGLQLGDSFQVFTDATSLEGSTFGIVDFIDPIIDAQSGLRRIHLLIENEDYNLISGQRVFASVSERNSATNP